MWRILKLKNFFAVSSDERGNDVVSWLCWMHFAWGMASSMIFSLLPLFIVDELGGSSRSFGMLEGAVIFLSFMAKLFAGFIMDIFKKKLPMLRTGAILTVLSKFFLACAPSVFFVFIAKSIDRFAKGLRQAPSDAVLAELATKKGLAYSLRYMMNLSGFLTGSIITSTIVAVIGKNFRLIFALAVIPTITAVYMLKTKVNYDDEKLYQKTAKHRWNIKDISLMPREYWKLITVVTLLMFNRFSEGFITLRAREVLPDHVSSLPIFMSCYEIFALCFALFIGKIADKVDKRKIMLFGIGLLFIADTFSITAHNVPTTIAIYIFAGLHIGATQGCIASMLAKLAPPNLVGTAFALYYGIDGAVLFCANNLAGSSSGLAKFLGFQGTASPFIIGAMFSSFAMVYIALWLKREKSPL